jgi:hypothetical protein
VTETEKVAAFDALAFALSHYYDGSDRPQKWAWWCCCPSGGENRFDDREGAVADLVAWAERTVKLKLKKGGMNALRVQLVGELCLPGGQETGRVPGDGAFLADDPGRGNLEGCEGSGRAPAVSRSIDRGTTPHPCG